MIVWAMQHSLLPSLPKKRGNKDEVYKIAKPMADCNDGNPTSTLLGNRLCMEFFSEAHHDRVFVEQYPGGLDI